MTSKLEVCCADIESVVAANAGGADRIELCSALEVGGLTPSIALITTALQHSKIPVRVLIRARPGNFTYSPLELQVMCRDIATCRSLGVDGVVIGPLTPGGAIDTDACKSMIEEAGGMSVTFHRAFDECTDAHEALDKIIAIGCDTLLTSGQKATALEGLPLISELVHQSNGRIHIMAGSGVNPANAAEILNTSGCPWIHGSARNGAFTSSQIVSQLSKLVHA